MQQDRAIVGSVGGSHFLCGLIDHLETYGPHVVKDLVQSIDTIGTCVDVGAGGGRDLRIVRDFHPAAKLIAIEGCPEYADTLAETADEVRVMNIERDGFPFEDESVDLFMANQVLEHTKEIFWIFHEITRSLKVGGHFIFGVPNVCSFHNRLLMLVGRHPTQHKVCSAHVRPFSKNDTITFLNACFPEGYEIKDFRGSQFYPFPRLIARPLANALPSAAFTIFFNIRKVKKYNQEFSLYPGKASFETNFWTGLKKSPYWESAIYDPLEDCRR